jgi:hypothetical protein
MAKQRPTLGTFAQPVGNFVQPIDPDKTVAPLDEQAIRQSYAFAEMFGQLSESAARMAAMIKKEQNQEEYLKGQDLVNQNRKDYADLVRSGEIKPSENPWLAVGAQEASGVLEAARAREQFKQKYEQDVMNNPELLKDHTYFDTLAASFAETKNAEFGTSVYLSRSFYKEFNPFLMEQSAKHSDAVGKYAQNKIIQSLQIKVDESLTRIQSSQRFGMREDGTLKDEGYYGVLYGEDGKTPMTELAIGVNIGGREMQIPMLVPGLSADARNKILNAASNTNPKELLASLPKKDSDLIFSHANTRISQGKSPFFSTMEDKVLPELQSYLDEMGKNMGMPRLANLSTAKHLIEMMEKHSLSYEAEDILRKLKTGTGMLADTDEVKAMLIESKPKIDAHRFEMKNKMEIGLTEAYIEAEFNKAYRESSAGSLSFGPDIEKFESFLKGMRTFDADTRNKKLVEYVEAWNRAEKEGGRSLDAASMDTIKREFSEAFAADKNLVKDFALMRKKLNDALIAKNVPLDSEKGRTVVRQMMASVSQAIESSRPQFIDALNETLKEVHRDRGEKGQAPQVTGFYPEQGDPTWVAEQKATYRGLFHLNRINAGIDFEADELLTEYRLAAMHGISVDMERGIDPRIADLAYAYAAGGSGAFPIEKLIPRTSAGAERMYTFLEQVTAMRSNGATLENAARDASQNIQLRINAMDFIKEADLQAVSSAMTERLSEFLGDNGDVGSVFENLDWFEWFSADMNVDAQIAFSNHYHKAYIEEVNRSASHSRGLEAANKAIDELVMYRGSVFPRAVMDKYNVDRDYLDQFIKRETTVPKATMVIVGYDSRRDPILALRTPEGNYINDRYYTFSEMSSEANRKDIIPRIKAAQDARRELMQKYFDTATDSRRGRF